MKIHGLVLILCLLIVLNKNSTAQNLAPNPHFTNYSICPGNGIGFPVDDWNQISSPDYFNECAGIWVLDVPTNFTGYQPSTTAAYIGLKNGEPLGSALLSREYAEALLTQPLIAGCYEITLIYSNADYGGFADGLGVLLSNGIPGTLIGQIPALEVTSNPPDSINWITVTSNYITAGGETNIILGNFRDNANVNFVPTSGTVGTALAYSLIDYVSVVYLGPTCQPTICLADAGLISLTNNPACPTESVSFNVLGQNSSPGFSQYILVTDQSGEILAMTSGSTFNFTYDQCANFTVYSYNLENIGSTTIPSVGDNISSVSCVFDCCDLVSEPFSFEDNIAPNFTLIPEHPNFPGGAPYTEIYCVDDIPALQDAHYNDNCIDMGTVMGMDEDSTNPCNGGLFYRTWEIADSCNITTETQTIIIEPSAIPVAINPPADLTLNCEEVPITNVPLTFSNGLTNSCALTTIIQPIRVDNFNTCGGDLQFVWSGMDDCGRVIQYTQNIVVLTATNPILETAPIDITLDCGVTNYVPTVLNYTNSSSGLCLIQGAITPTTTTVGDQIIVDWTTQATCGAILTATQVVTLQPGPNISIDPDSITICEGSSYDLNNLVITDANNTGASISYHDASPPDATNELSSTIVTPGSTTDYYIAASLNGSCVDVDTFTLVVTPPIDLVADGSGTVCRDTSYHSLFDFLAFANDSSGVWMDLDGAGLNLSDPFNVQFNNVPVGEYNFSYLIPSSGTCPSDSAIATITVEPLPEIVITSIDCSNDLNFYSLSFSTVANALITNSEGTLSNPSSGNYEITSIPIANNLTLSIQDPNTLCQIQTTIIPPDCNCPLVNPPINDGDVVTCVEDLPITLSVTLGVDQNASWYDAAIAGTLLSANTNSYQPSVLTPGTYTFFVESFDLLNPDCKSTTRTPVSLTIINPPTVNDIQIAACQNEDGINTLFFLQTTNDLISTNSAYSFSYHLTFNQAVDNSVAIVDPYTVVGLLDQIIYARVVDGNGCFSIAEVTLSVRPPPTISLNTTDVSCPGVIDGSLQITVLSSLGNLITSLNNAPFNSDLIYNNLDTGTYTLSIQDDQWCSYDYTFTIQSNNEIFVDQYALVCDDNGSPSDPSDDFYNISFYLSTDGSGTMYNLTADVTDFGQFSYELNQSIVLPADGNTHTLRFLDLTTGCDRTITTVSLVPCSDPCVTFPNSTILVDPSNVLDCAVSSVNLSSMNETDVDYQWSFNNNPLNDLSLDQAGQVILIAIDTLTGCQSTDTLDILDLEAYPLIDLVLNDTISCDMPTVEIDASLSQGGNQFEYNWYFDGLLINDFSNQNLVSVNTGGWYVLEIIDLNLACVNQDSVFVEEFTPSWNLSLDTELTYNQGDNMLTVSTSLPTDQISSISWSPSDNLSCDDCLNPTILAPGINQYTVTITDIFGCNESASISILYQEKEVYIPNGFSPNGDGINDYFELGLPTDYELTQLEMWIFNRWGELVYYQDNLHTAPSTSFWDGRFKNTYVNPAVFVYYMEATTIDNQQISKHGDLTLTR